MWCDGYVDVGAPIVSAALRLRDEGRDDRVKRRRSSPKAQNGQGKSCGNVKRPASLHRQTGACRRCGQAVSQPYRRRLEPVEAQAALRPTTWGRSSRLHPGRPADKAINLNRQPGVQRPERSTPGRRTGARTIEGPTSNFNRRTGPRTKDQRQTSSIAARAACEGPTSNSAVSSIPSWAEMPVQQGSRTQISKVGNLEKPTAQPVLPHPRPDVKGFGATPAKSFNPVHVWFMFSATQVHMNRRHGSWPVSSFSLELVEGPTQGQKAALATTART